MGSKRDIRNVCTFELSTEKKEKKATKEDTKEEVENEMSKSDSAGGRH